MLLALHLEVGQLLPEPCVFRLEVDRVLEPGLGLGKLPVDPQSHPDLQVAVGQVGIQAEGFEICATRLVPAVQAAARRCPGCDDGSRDPAGAGPPPGCESRLPRARPRSSRTRLSPLRAAAYLGAISTARTQVFERFIVLAELAQHHREVPVSLGEIGPQLQGAPEVFDRFTGTARRLDRQTERAQGLGIIRIELQAPCDSSQSSVSTGRDF